MIYLIIYDISNDKIRTKISKRLIAEGYERIQFSVFAGNFDPVANKILISEIKEWLKEDPEAKFFVLPVTLKSFKNMYMIGNNTIDIDLITGEKNTLYI